MTISPDDADWLQATARLAGRGTPLSAPNPAVGALIVADEKVIGRGWTRRGGRPHAEAVALEQAGERARGATLYVTLEPCAHASPRGPACADLVARSGLARVIVGTGDPDPRTAGAGIARLRDAGIAVTLAEDAASRASLAGYLLRTTDGRPHVTLKLALSADDRLGRGHAVTGAEARAHAHAWRAKMDAILVGGGTLRDDAPRLDVRLPGLAVRSPRRWLLSRGAAPDGWHRIAAPTAIIGTDAQWLMVEGGGATATAFLAAGLVDRLLLYRAPLVLGADGGPPLPALSEAALAASAHWRCTDRRALGNDRVEVYERA